MSQKVYILSACRTAIGSFGGSLKDIPAVRLGETVLREAIARAGIEPGQIDEVLMGNVIQAGLGQNPARQAMIYAGIPVETPAMTLNKVCGSGLEAVNLAASMIRAGDAQCLAVGGMENMSAAPYCLNSARFGYRMNDGALKDTMITDALLDVYNNYHMGITAENVAERYGVTREMQDAFAASSQQKCEAAQAAGKFADEIVPVTVKVKKAEVVFDRDEFPRAGVTAESLAKLKPAFKRDGGTVTAGNASGINDGAAALIVASEEFVQKHALKPIAEFVAGTSAGVDPAIMGVGPVFAIRKLLAKTGMTMDDIDLIEANEAFAAQSVAVANELGFDMQKVNVNGGAIALGHPVGASGARILVTLIYEMLRRADAKAGLATLCVGGGMGVAAIVRPCR